MDEQAIGGDGARAAREDLGSEDETRASDAADLDRRFRELVRESPLLSMAVAIATGFVLGRLLSGR